MKKNYYSRKLRQFKNATTQLNLLLANNSSNPTTVKSLTHKVNHLLKELKTIFSAAFIKKSLAGASFVLGLFFANNANAQSFSAPVLYPFNLDSLVDAAGMTLNDFDGDGDFDMMIAGVDDVNTFYYVPNNGSVTAPNFGTPVSNPFGINMVFGGYGGTSFPTSADIDNDGDFDIIAGLVYGGVTLFENTGTATAPSFSAQQDNPFNIGIDPATFISVPTFADLDDDGDLDLYVGGYYGTIQYCENTGTAAAPNFTAVAVNPFNISTNTANYLSYPTFSDFDNDGDKDLLMGNLYFTQFEYFENTGTASAPSFAAPTTNPFGLTPSVGVAMPSNLVDIDFDGDKDLFSGIYDSLITYYACTTGPAVGIGELKPDFITTVYPSPANDVISITFSGNKDAVSKIEVLDISGKVVLSSSQLINELNIKHLEAGMYTVKISDKTGKATQTKIQKI